MTTVTDPEGRPTVLDLLRGVAARVYPVGRLDYLSEGLLLLTNDGELAQKLTHASSHVPKTYLVKISGKPTEEQIEKLRGGILLPAKRSPLKTPAGREPKPGCMAALDGGADRSGAHQTVARGRQSLVRGDAGRGTQSANPADVRRDRASRGKDQAGALRTAGVRRRARQVSASNFAGSCATEECRGRKTVSAPAVTVREAVEANARFVAGEAVSRERKEQMPRRLKPARDDKHEGHHRGAKAVPSARTKVRVGTTNRRSE